MTDFLLDYFLNPPGRLKTFGRIMSSAGMALIVSGIYFSAGLSAIDAMLKSGGVEGAPETLAEAYPGIPTWFIPEGPFGFIIAALLVVCGLYAAYFARKVERLT